MTLTDTGPLVALPNSADDHHRRCIDALPGLKSPLVTSLPCIIEALYFLGCEFGWLGQKKLWDLWSQGKLVVLDLPPDGLERMAALMAKYADNPMDAADASLIVLAEEHGFDQIFTVDSGFRAFRTRDRRALRVIP